MARYDLTDFDWKVIQPLLPKSLAEFRVSMIGGF